MTAWTNSSIVWPYGSFSAGSVTCVFTTDVESARNDVQDWATQLGGDVRLVMHDCHGLPAHSALLELLVRSLAGAARLLWPDWYGPSLADNRVHGTEAAGTAEQSVATRLAARRLGRARSGVNTTWLTAAAAACQGGDPPFLAQFSLAVQVRQLALALAENDLVLAVCIHQPTPVADRLLALARGLEWFAREADAPVLAVLPDTLAGRAELDGISSTAWHWKQEAPASADESVVATITTEEQKHLVCPIIGRPHPASPGEQLLAERLARDPELAGLFGFNQRVTTVFDSRFLVDLVWPDGRVAVEVDGYGHHSSRAAFNVDRQRDYELTLSGYLVLRLPHDFVVQDVGLAIERIREFVRFRIQHPLTHHLSKSETSA